MATQRNRHAAHEKRKQREESEQAAKAIQQAQATRPRVTPLSVLLGIVLLMLLVIFLHGLQRWRMEAKSKARAEAMKPVIDTTMTIESAPWKIRMRSIRRGQSLPESHSELLDELNDGWGNPTRIVFQDNPVSSYLIAGAGQDARFDTEDDISIRFGANHDQLERINTYGLKELEMEMNALEMSQGLE